MNSQTPAPTPNMSQDTYAFGAVPGDDKKTGRADDASVGPVTEE